MTETIYENCGCCGTVVTSCCPSYNVPTVLYGTFTDYSCIGNAATFTYNSSQGKWYTETFNCGGQDLFFVLSCDGGMITVTENCNGVENSTSNTLNCDPFFMDQSFFATTESCADSLSPSITVTE